ncbi:hypothetical protein Caci_2995 [Catenulispora acidiphila DSM 44928]|uniref:Uncharacterized protein n=1 Tax=Catenulispora acidiphila (strain DSM 44928 / JCM 14897 / NBRC 102108 / NRRL B-24433 / ID139908) TaxID=479433 RepID=C7Q312_CATAD|nr:hypothetical protein [Catenulispora acidiphila]ACU71904.1 hypothetical protein Caci_2995 [Catenulispora acidiphila DSM 44928]
MKAIAVITIPDNLATRWQRDVGAADHADLAVVWLDEAITDIIATRIVGIDEGDAYDEVRDEIEVSVVPDGSEF